MSDDQSAKTMREGGDVSQTSSTQGDVSQTSKTQGEGGKTHADEHGAGKPNIHALIGRTVDRYKIMKLLGEGGFGAVYKAEHTLMKRDVAFKTLHAELGKDPAVLYRFKKEGQVAARFRHKNAIELYDFGQMEDGTYFMAMEFLPGRDLRDYLKNQGALEVAFAFDVMIQTLAALQAAHDGGVIHRDLKPDNIKLEEREGRKDFVKVLDFGIAKIKDPKEPVNPLDDQTGKITSDEAKSMVAGLGTIKKEEVDNSYKTQVGAFFGTPEYGSPEQCAGDEIDHRSDLYTMGVILYEILTGQLPFVSKTPQGYLAQHMVAPPRPLAEIRPDLKIPADVEAIIMKSMEKRPEDRYQTATEFAEGMIACAKKNKIPITIASIEGEARTPIWKIAVPFGVLITALVLFIVFGGEDKIWVQAQSDYGELLRAGKLESALAFVQKPDEALIKGLADRKKWYEDRKREVTDKIAKRDQVVAQKIDEIDKAYNAKSMEERDFDPFVDQLERFLADYIDVRAHEPSRRQVMAKQRDITGARNAAAEEFWTGKNGREPQIEKRLNLLDFKGARELCSLPERFEKANGGREAEAVKKMSAKIDERDTAAQTDPHISAALRAFKEANTNRKNQPTNWPDHYAAFTDFVAKYGDTPLATVVKVETLQEIQDEWRSAGEVAAKALESEVDQLFAAPPKVLDRYSSEDYTKDYARAFAEVEAFDPKFKDPKSAKDAWERLVAKVVDDTKTRYENDLNLVQVYRNYYQPDVALEIVKRWTAFPIPQVAPQMAQTVDAAVKLADRLAHVVSLHKDMEVCPNPRVVSIGAPRKEGPGGIKWDTAESPIHAQDLATAFFIDRREVSNAEYASFLMDNYATDAEREAHAPPWWRTPGLGGTATTPPPGLEQNPVREVTQEDAAAFAEWAGKRLPTEFEWEYAARGDTAERQFTWSAKHSVSGDRVVPKSGTPPSWTRLAKLGVRPKLVLQSIPDEPTARVGSFENTRSEPFNLYDMTGNVLEWTSSFFLRYEDSEAPEDFGPHRIVARGGAYDALTLEEITVTKRYAFDIGSRPPNVGFRCVKNYIKERGELPKVEQEGVDATRTGVEIPDSPPGETARPAAASETPK